jgi:chorismate synthase
VPAAGVVAEAMVAFVLADAYRQKFGGDHLDDARAALRAYCERIGWQTS